MTIPNENRERWLTALRDSAHELDAFLDSLSPEPAPAPPGGWSLNEHLEHLVLVEERVLRALRVVLAKPGEPPASPLTDAEVWSRALGQGTRAAAPEAVCPTGGRGGRESLRQEFRRLREATIHFASTTDEPVQQRTVRMPVGEIDGGQCFLMLSAHLLRHLRQMQVAQNV